MSRTRNRTGVRTGIKDGRSEVYKTLKSGGFTLSEIAYHLGVTPQAVGNGLKTKGRACANPQESAEGFKISYGISIPSRRKRYPFPQMRPGASIDVVGHAEGRKVRNAAYQYAKKTQRETGAKVIFALRCVSKGKSPIYRLWRTE